MADEAFFSDLLSPLNGQPRLPQPQALEEENSRFPVLSWNSSNSQLVNQMKGAKDGVMLITDLNLEVPIIGARETFCKLYDQPQLHLYLNKFHETRGLFKFRPLVDKGDKLIDRKVIFDLSPTHITQIHDRRVVWELGQGFHQVMDFYNSLEERVVPRLLGITSSVIAGEGLDSTGIPKANKVLGIHYGMNHKLRLVDYFPVNRTAHRSGDHRDITTCTLIFQDKGLGGLEVFVDNKWTPVPAQAELVLIWGWSAFILSNGRLRVPLHRVVPIKTEKKKCPRRNEIVLYVSPDSDAFLAPHFVFPGEVVAFNTESIRGLTFKDFKTRFELKWHQREGTTTTEEEVAALNQNLHQIKQSQDDAIINFLLGLST